MALSEGENIRIFSTLDKPYDHDNKGEPLFRAVQDTCDEQTIKKQPIHPETNETMVKYALRTGRLDEILWLIHNGAEFSGEDVYPDTNEDLLQHVLNKKQYDEVTWLIGNGFPLEKYELINFDLSHESSDPAKEAINKQNKEKFATMAGQTWENLDKLAKAHPAQKLITLQNKNSEQFYLIEKLVDKECIFYTDTGPGCFQDIIQMKNKLYMLAIQGDDEIYQALPDYAAKIIKARSSGVDVINIENYKGYSIASTVNRESLAKHLFKAVRSGDELLLSILLEFDMSPDSISSGSNKKTLMSTALDSRQAKCALILLNFGANPNGSYSSDSTRNTYLHQAVQRNNYDMVRFLIENCANPDSTNVRGDTPLHIATKKSNEGMIAMLAKKGGCINIRNFDGNTPLHIAAKQFLSGTFVQLIEAGADFTITNNKAATATNIVMKVIMYYMILPSVIIFTSFLALSVIGIVPAEIAFIVFILAAILITFVYFSYGSRKLLSVQRKKRQTK